MDLIRLLSRHSHGSDRDVTSRGSMLKGVAHNIPESLSNFNNIDGDTVLLLVDLISTKRY
jgi:hypothetical protein